MRLVALVAVLMLGGCLVLGEPKATGTDVNTLLYTVGEVRGAGKRLIPFTTLDGYLATSGGGNSRSMRALTGLDRRVANTRDPIAIGAGENGVYIIDDATNGLYRFRWGASEDRDSETGLAEAEFKRLRLLTDVTAANDLFVASNGDVFVSDGKGRKVVRYDKDGGHLQDFVDADNLNRPVSVTIDSRALRIFIADGLYDRVLVFNPQGRSLYGIGFRGDGPGGFKNIRSMVQGRDGLLYVVNGVRQQIQTYGLDGTYVGSFGQGAISDPDGMVVDDENRVYVADSFNHKIQIFAAGKQVESYGKYGTGPGEFSRPGRLAYFKGMLYVADRGNSRIQVLKVVPEKLVAGGRAP
jgi:sugar lactone lactonase YvrE